MNLYVAGPMTGFPEWNFPAFEDAARRLRAKGYDVVSPHEIDLEDGFDPSGHGEGFDLRAALERDVEEVLKADGLALLDGWEESPGAVIEVLTASSKGAPARPVRDWLRGIALALVLLTGLGGAVRYLADSPEAATRARRDPIVQDVRQIVDDVEDLVRNDSAPALDEPLSPGLRARA